VSPFAYSEVVGAPRGPNHGVGHRPDLHLARVDDDIDQPSIGRPAELVPHGARLAGLTARDVVVLGFLAEGWTTADIAHELVYAESTIKKEVHLIVRRLAARNRTHAVAMAIRDEVI
jgi:DNA-binding NarL/FixJ family response regulator